MAKPIKRGRPKDEKMFSFQLKRSEHGELVTLFSDLANAKKLSDYIRRGVRLVHLIESRQWDTLLDENPEFWALILNYAPKPQIIVQGGGQGAPSDVTPIKLDSSATRRNEDDDDAFNRIFGDIGI
jgi:hypothetical protein